MRKIILCLFLVTFLFACYSNSSDVTGVYVLNKKGVSDTLTISRNGTFNQHFVNVSGVSFINSGKWTVVDGRIGMDDYVFYEPGFGAADHRKCYWPASYEVTFGGGMRIVLDGDLEIYYVRRKVIGQ